MQFLSYIHEGRYCVLSIITTGGEQIHGKQTRFQRRKTVFKGQAYGDNSA